MISASTILAISLGLSAVVWALGKMIEVWPPDPPSVSVRVELSSDTLDEYLNKDDRFVPKSYSIKVAVPIGSEIPSDLIHKIYDDLAAITLKKS